MKNIQRPGVATLLTERYRLQSRVHLGLEEFVVPTSRVADDSKAEADPIVRSGSAQFSQGIVAAERAVAQFQTVPGIIGVIRQITVTNIDVVSFLFVHFGPSFAVVPTNVADSRFTDGRLLGQGSQNPGGRLVFDTQVAALASFEYRLFMGVAETRVFQPNNWVCGTGNANETGFIEFAMSSLITGMALTVEWDEYEIV